MIYSVNQNGEITQNNIVDLKEHLVDEYYIIVPRYWTIDSFGAINSKKPIKVTNENSLLCYDEVEKQIVLKRVTDYLNEPIRYYLMIGAPEINMNNKAIIKKDGQEYEIEFNYITGFMLALYLKQLAGVENIISTRIAEIIDAYEEDWSEWFNIKYNFYKKTFNSSLSSLELHNIKDNTSFKALADVAIRQTFDNNYTIANEFFYSTNIHFVTGIFEALILTEKLMSYEISELITHKNINPSIYTNCLNVFFANYSITKASYYKYPEEYQFNIKYTISPLKTQYIRYSDKKVKQHPYTRFIKPDGSMTIENWNRYTDFQNSDNAVNETVKGLMELKANDKIKFIRFDELIVSHVKTEPEPLYDIIMGNGSATNYLLPCAPWAKNSDGDVLAVMALMTEDALKAGEKLMMSNVDRLKDGTNPDKIRNWIQKDAVVGLYQATKDE